MVGNIQYNYIHKIKMDKGLCILSIFILICVLIFSIIRFCSFNDLENENQIVMIYCTPKNYYVLGTTVFMIIGSFYLLHYDWNAIEVIFEVGVLINSFLFIIWLIRKNKNRKKLIITIFLYILLFLCFLCGLNVKICYRRSTN